MMLLAQKFALSPSAVVAPQRRAPVRVAPLGFAPSEGSPVSELWLRTGGGSGAAEGFGSHSHDSEMDLAMFVSDFLENGGNESGE